MKDGIVPQWDSLRAYPLAWYELARYIDYVDGGTLWVETKETYASVSLDSWDDVGPVAGCSRAPNKCGWYACSSVYCFVLVMHTTLEVLCAAHVIVRFYDDLTYRHSDAGYSVSGDLYGRDRSAA